MRRAVKPGERRQASSRSRPRRDSRRGSRRGPSAKRWRQVTALILDCDGVLTDGSLFYDRQGPCQLVFDAKDGLGLALLCRAGIPVGVLSGRATEIAERRLRELGIEHFSAQCRDKAAGLTDLCREMGVTAAAAAFVGDDILDLPAFAGCGLAIAVADAVAEVRQQADWITRAPGGRGAVREVCEAILRARGDWPPLGWR